MQLTTERNVYTVKKGQKGSKKEKPCLTPKGLVGANKLISEFIERNVIAEFINRISKELKQENHQSISDLFTAKNGCYHYSCILDQRHKLKIVADQSPQNSGSSDNLRSSKRRSGDLLDELKCLFCSEIDTQGNLIEAGIKYATKKKVDVSHANEKTIKWCYMALAFSKIEIASKLSLGDLGSNELFYHRSYLTVFHNDSNALAECERSALHDAMLQLCVKLLNLSMRKSERN